MDLDKEIIKLKQDFLTEIERIKSSKALRDLEIKYLGRKGDVTRILRDLKNLAVNERPKIGDLANQVKNEISKEIKRVASIVKGEEVVEEIDQTLPGKKIERGHLHLVSQVQYELEDIFKSLGFMVLEGPEIESDYYNFEALNIPPHLKTPFMLKVVFYYVPTLHLCRLDQCRNTVRLLGRYFPDDVSGMKQQMPAMKQLFISLRD